MCQPEGVGVSCQGEWPFCWSGTCLGCCCCGCGSLCLGVAGSGWRSACCSSESTAASRSPSESATVCSITSDGSPRYPCMKPCWTILSLEYLILLHLGWPPLSSPALCKTLGL